ncbi:VWA domain-containing protein [Mycolicibacterium austroafricanum]|uniref:Mg-protoporphyrin IX chelatase n=1 Tax=Mycolicibacterium austroafricanum TaxID=39687 RepID=A0ABT8H8Q0_MYCAO|nr:VWA domain-containing protein [Mycolicibacterium austroafricanum]MDN4517133.1 VWA domain-containing protein [Mycolicibacterium austroafricanum]
MLQLYPFCAVLGADPDAPEGLDDMALALVLSVIAPGIGGVLVRGEKGTAKSTLVRALTEVLPHIEVIAGDRFSTDPAEQQPLSPDGPFDADAAVETRPVRLVELPVGATEDRVAGSIHLERALSEGTVHFEPGLLAKAHRGILYVDEVNLLHDHLVDLLLDAAAMGRLTVERDGISVTHAARFVIVGTMNPEEGELRPQLLDRFGLTVEVAAPQDPAQRAEVVRRRLEFDADPEGFRARYAETEQRLRVRIEAAQTRLPEVELTSDVLLKIAEICSAFGVDGMRADIVTARTAAAHAAWQGRNDITAEDLRVASRLALPHRRRRNPFDAPGLSDGELDDLLPPDTDESPGPDPDTDPDGPDGGGSDRPDGDGAPPPARGDDTGRQEGGPAPTPVGAGEPYKARLFTVAGVGDGQSGRRSRARTSTGRRVGATPSAAAGTGIHLVETVRSAAPHQHARGRSGGRIILEPGDLRRAVREGREANLVLFVVDTSGSMAARERMRQVKTAILSLLLDAYRRRDRVGVVTFRDRGADLALPPTRSVDIAARRLDDLPAGGRTPLAEGLLEAAEVVRRERLRDPGRRPLLVVVTDGRATAGPDAVNRSRQAAAHLARQGVGAVVVDCENGRIRMGLAHTLAEYLAADHVRLSQVSAEALTDIVRDVTREGAA